MVNVADPANGGSVTTDYFAGGSYEVSGSSVKRYYSLGGQTNLDTDGTLSYLLTDQLGSVVSVTDASGNPLSNQRYMPFGQLRPDVGQVSQTDRGYTGQKLLSGLNGLMDYNARVYDSYTGRWTQPDTVTSDIFNPQNLNLFEYALNNPILHTDPTGHVVPDPTGCARYGCPVWDYSSLPTIAKVAIAALLNTGLFGPFHADVATSTIRTPTADSLIASLGMVDVGFPEMPAETPSESIQLYRTMIQDEDGLPATKETMPDVSARRTLGVRLPGDGTSPVNDITPDADGQVSPGQGGMSTVPGSPKTLLGKQEPVWCIDSCDLGPELRVNRNEPDHAFIEPAYRMPVDQYQAALYATRASWRLVAK